MAFTGTVDGPRLMRQYLGVQSISDVQGGDLVNPWIYTDTLASGTRYGLQILPTYNQTATAAATDLLINRTETAVGSGSQYLIDAQVGGTSKFRVDNSGNIYRAGTETGSKRNIITGATTLTASQSGSLCVWNAAAGYLFTLPAAAAGLMFDFYVQTTITSVGAKVITAAGTTFLQGPVISALSATTPGANPGPKYFIGDGTGHISINMWGTTSDTTSGGVAGSSFRLTCYSATQWIVTCATIVATGTIVTPFANS